jgi:hypothetical protein
MRRSMRWRRNDPRASPVERRMAKAKQRSKTADKAHRSKRAGPGARTIAIGVTAGLGAIAAIAVGFSMFARRGGGEHPAPDLAAGKVIGSERAPVDFRPDPTAPVPASEREGLRPATGPGPSITSMRGEMANQTTV